MLIKLCRQNSWCWSRSPRWRTSSPPPASPTPRHQTTPPSHSRQVGTVGRNSSHSSVSLDTICALRCSSFVQHINGSRRRQKNGVFFKHLSAGCIYEIPLVFATMQDEPPPPPAQVTKILLIEHQVVATEDDVSEQIRSKYIFGPSLLRCGSRLDRVSFVE